MARQILRGYRWGHNSAELDRHSDLAARVATRFACPHGHAFAVRFAVNADVPTQWTCPQHGREHCRRIDITTTATVTPASARRGRPPRTHLVMLHERRSKAELEALLATTLAAIRRQRGGAHLGATMLGGRPYSFRYDD
jgi:hypothetical protein